MSDTEMDTPSASHTTKVTSKSNKPDVYNGERNELEPWLLQVDRYFHLEGDKIDDNDMVVWATTFLRGNAGKWVTPIIRRYMDDTVEDTENKNLVEDWDTFKAKMREVFSPFQEKVIAEQKIQQLRQTRSAADYTTEFQQYQVVIEWDNNALMRMYKQGLKPQVRTELMRSGASISTLQELMNEAIRIDNDLYGLKLEERLFAQGMRAPGNTNVNARAPQTPRRSYPNQGRQRSYTPRIPGAYRTNGYEPMHLDKGPGKPKCQGNKDSKKDITCYACGKKGHMKRDCRSQGKVVRQLNVLHRAVPDNEDEETWNVITRPNVNLQGHDDGIVNGLEDLTLITQEDATSDEASASEDESYEDLEATEIDQTKFSKMERFKEAHRPATPFVPSDEMLLLSQKVNQLRWYLNKDDVDYAYETPNIMAAMRQDLHFLFQEVRETKGDIPEAVRHLLPTDEELDWVNRAIEAYSYPTPEPEPEHVTIRCPEGLDTKINILLRQLGRPEVTFNEVQSNFYTEFEKYNQFVDLCEELRDQGMSPELALRWTMDAQASWQEPTQTLSDAEKEGIYDQIQRQCEPSESQLTQEELEELRLWETPTERKAKRKAHKISRATDTYYWLDYRNPEHIKLSWTACAHDTCSIHYSDKARTNWFPRRIHGTPKCKWDWFECTTDSCPIHLYNKRIALHFPGHIDPQAVIEMQTVYDTEIGGHPSQECNQTHWHTCLHPDCDKHRIAKDFHGFGKSFLDQQSRHKELERRLTV
jgi:hypothetical protein